ncbi:intracellular multiplication protein IcmL [Aliiroseovarius crassostreae]|uniref:Bacterial virulence protein VirB8 domain-containing protein n=1 Tax=Aliiroseovarius crassostreae TaxID=154981 RepID=A0A0P7IWF5_9RHOB|nr:MULTISPECIES: DotI/IcmL family type IV secretion protein [Rhodobacterales]KPN62951.1 hypothetical protein AKJ29_02045 [Aliiroseovarius crassostreae]UTS82803.1 hypothetical protein OL67_003913 [Phaeobacter piscinae]SFU89520.1 intracellular multiplication protein IcmL [Aliiroseovarius crassostreae]
MKLQADIDVEMQVSDSLARNQKVVFGLSVFLLFVVIIANIQVASALLNRFPLRQYIYTQNAAAVCTFAPVEEPGIVTDAIVTNFAAGIALELNSLDFANWRKDINDIMDASFTKRGRLAYLEALDDSSILKTVLQERYAMASIIREDEMVVVTAKGVDGGRYVWRVTVPVTIGYATDKDYRPENRDLEIIVVRAPVTADNPYGLLIDAVFSAQTLANDSDRASLAVTAERDQP